jgi:hypothetical protein
MWILGQCCTFWGNLWSSYIQGEKNSIWFVIS